jgi:adenylate kinase family enzyme
MKIHIIGGSGTGKTFYAEKISKQYNISHYDLDDIFWDNNAISYGTRMPIEKRTELLNRILTTENWIIEGVYYKWLNDSFSSADWIFILIISPIIFNFRIIKRFIKRKLGIQKGKKETIKSLFGLLVWTNNYYKHEIPEIINYLNEYKNKIVFVKKFNDIFDHLNNKYYSI